MRRLLGILPTLSVCVLGLSLLAADDSPQQQSQVQKKKATIEDDLPPLRSLEPPGQEQGQSKKQIVDELPKLKPLEGGEDSKSKENKGQPGKVDVPPPKPEDPKEVMARLAKNLELVENRLKENDTGQLTRETQKKIIDDLDKLIHQQQQQEKDKQQQQQQQQQNQKQKKQDQSQQKKQRKDAGPKKSQNNSQPGNDKSSKSEGDNTGEGSKKEKGGKGEDPNNELGGKKKQGTSESEKNADGNKTRKDLTSDSQKKGKADEAMKGTLVEMFRDEWGKLPEKMRMEMDAYSRAQFMPRYDQILRQYYRTIAEQGQRTRRD